MESNFSNLVNNEQKIIFYVAILKDLDHLLGKGEFFIHFLTGRFRDVDTFKVKMKPFMTWDRFIILRSQVIVDRRWLEKPIFYNYVFVSHGGRSVLSEVFNESSSMDIPKRNKHRILKIPNSLLIHPFDYHQIDDIISLPDSSVSRQDVSELYFDYLSKYDTLCDSEKILQILMLTFIYHGFHNAEFSSSLEDTGLRSFHRLEDEKKTTKAFYKIALEIIDEDAPYYIVSSKAIMVLSLIGHFHVKINLPDVLLSIDYIVAKRLKLTTQGIQSFKDGVELDSYFLSNTRRFIVEGLGMLLQKIFLRSGAFFQDGEHPTAKCDIPFHSWSHLLLLIHVFSEEIDENRDIESNTPVQNSFEKEYFGLRAIGNTNPDPLLIEYTMRGLRHIHDILTNNRLLQKSLSYFMKPQHFPDAILSAAFDDAVILHAVSKYLYNCTETPPSMREFIRLEEVFHNVIGRWKNTKGSTQRIDIVKRLLDILNVSVQRISFDQSSYRYFSSAVNCIIAYYTKILKRLPDDCKSVYYNIDQLIASFRTTLARVSWLYCSHKDITYELKVHELLYKLVLSGFHERNRIADVSEILRDRIMDARRINPDRFVQLCTEIDVSGLMSVSAVLSNQIMEFLKDEQQLLSETDWLIKLSEQKWIYKIVVQNFNTMFEKRINSFYTIHFLLHCKAILKYFQLFGKKRDKHSGKALKHVTRELELFYTSLCNSTVTIQLLDSLNEKKEVLFEIVDALVGLGVLNTSLKLFQTVIFDRLGDLDALNHFKSSVNFFISICSFLKEFGVPVDYLELQKEITTTVPDSAIKEVVENGAFKNVSRNPELKHMVHNFDVIREHGIMESVLFVAILQQEAEMLLHKNLKTFAYDVVYSTIFLHAINKCKDLLIEMLSLKISVAVLTKTFLSKRNGAPMKKFLDLLNKSGIKSNEPMLSSHVNETFHSAKSLQNEFRLLQNAFGLADAYPERETVRCAFRIAYIFEMKRCVTVTKLILEIAKYLKLEVEAEVTEAYTQLLLLAKMKISDVKKAYSNQFLKYALFSEDMVKVLKAISKSLPFIEWVQMLKGLKEVKVFVDILMIAADQEVSEETDRVVDFEACCTAFAPFIFDIKSNASISDIAAACQATVTALTTDKDGLKKLVTCNNKLAWFKEAKEREVSVAYKAFSEAETANKKGRYVIGSVTTDQFFYDVATLDNMVFLELSTDEDTVTKKITIEQIIDLQSRLMLISIQAAKLFGDEEETEKEYFLQKSDHVTRLCTVLVSLAEAGDYTMLNYQSDIVCDIDSWSALGSTSYFRPITTLIESFEAKLKSWEYFTKQCRNKYPILNMFSVKQCLYLQKQFYILSVNVKNDSENFQSIPIDLHTLLQPICNVESIAKQLVNLKLNNTHECVSLEQLGEQLTEFSKKPQHLQSQVLLDGCKQNVENFFNKDRPTLVTLPQDDVLPAVLDVYLSQLKRFPNSYEVLLCNEETSLELIKLLLLRAFHDKKNIYSLVFLTHTLEYKLCEEAIRFLKQLVSDEKGIHMCNLLVITGSESTGSFYISSALQSCRADFVRSYTNKEIAHVLKKHMSKTSKTHVALSSRGGMGKTMFIQKAMQEEIRDRGLTNQNVTTVTVYGTKLDMDEIVDFISDSGDTNHSLIPRFYHFDISPTVTKNVDYFVFHLVIFGCCQKRNGKMWRRATGDVCYIEATELSVTPSNVGMMLSFLPTQQSMSPNDLLKDQIDPSLQTIQKKMISDISTEFVRNISIQRVYFYLNVFAKEIKIQDHFDISRHCEKDGGQILAVLTRYCGIVKPSWYELINFVSFFNQQLLDSENSIFTSLALQRDLRGFKEFVITFLLEMAKDFSTPSINEEELWKNNLFVELKRRWEHSFHPYLFFNQDGQTLTFFGFNVNQNGDLIDSITSNVRKKQIMSVDLYTDLARQFTKNDFGLDTNYENLTRDEKLTILCRVLGVKKHDPDLTYDLTVDNMKKILAIHMRFRCGIPVVLMGETGCGKTSLINFFANLRVNDTAGNSWGQDIINLFDKLRVNDTAGNSWGQHIPLIVVKVHGGVTAKDISRRLHEAIKIAKSRQNDRTLLFFDEANTTDAIDVIKEIMVDNRINGKFIDLNMIGLDIVAACNPYRRHSPNMLIKLESAGLGYHVGRDLTYEKIGDIPLRQLVYRVHPLPQSMKSLVWDFGQLDADTERNYTAQIIKRCFRNNRIPNGNVMEDILLEVLCSSQQFMRNLEDECSFVSLRDVERTVQVMAWFYNKMDLFSEYAAFDKKSLWKEVNSIILALGVCYIAKLEDKDSYIERIAPLFDFYEDGIDFENLLHRCHRMFVDELQLDENIARNEALCENIFMMTVCIELRIPLFIIGKPGSSKSLAKTIVHENMHGSRSKSPFFKEFKQIHMVTYQCSPLSTADSIITTFKQASRYQVKKDLNNFSSVVVLDEVGLAEDSSRMPLKTLHSLLEDGTDGSEELLIDEVKLKSKKVAFIGISNWSLDPAKMNRGIILFRQPPTLQQLVQTALDICTKSSTPINKNLFSVLHVIAEAYLKVYEQQKTNENLQEYKKEEFFGLRDFYSLVKMLHCLTRRRGEAGELNIDDFQLAVQRNFGGLDVMNPWEIFYNHYLVMVQQPITTKEKSINTLDLIQSSLSKTCPCHDVRADQEKSHCSNARYLLIMTEEYTALPIIEELYLKNVDNVDIIFGSSFPKDQEFTQVCRNINRIKMCMETGRTVVLLNMDSLYESLYDALNQYYVYLYGNQYVDLGLGTQRVKCMVHENFKLIVIADKDKVFKDFPIPLINRLEKHYVVTGTCINTQTIKGRDMDSNVKRLKKWAKAFSSVQSKRNYTYTESDAFVTFHDDTCASIVIHLEQIGCTDASEVFERGKSILIKIATPDAIARLFKSKLASEANLLWKMYFEEQKHLSLEKYLCNMINARHAGSLSYTQITTFSYLLSEAEVQAFSLPNTHTKMISLMEFHTEQSFRDTIKSFITYDNHRCSSLLIIQCNHESIENDLVACTKYICQEMAPRLWTNKKYHLSIVYILQLKQVRRKIKSFSGALSTWSRLHLDELRESSAIASLLTQYSKRSISSLFDINQMDESQFRIIVSIIKRCIQKILAVCAEEIPTKIRLLSQLLDFSVEFSILKKDAQYSFMKHILSLIHQALVDKEKGILPENLCRWVHYEAVEQKHLPDYGTFCQALVCCIEERISPVLSNIIQQIDRNNNLLIIQNKPVYNTLWMTLMKKAVFLNDHKTDESIRRFSNSFPFSCHIISSVNDILQASIGAGSTFNRLEQMNYIFRSQLFGADLSTLTKDAINDYAFDLICNAFDLSQPSLYEVFQAELLAVAKDMVSRFNKTKHCDSTVTIPTLHIALEKYKDRFHYAAVICQQHADVSDDVLSMWSNTSSHEQNIIIDVLMMHHLLKKLFVFNFSLQNARSWISDVKKIRTTLQNFLHFANTHTNLFGTDANALLEISRLLWTKIRILQLYVDNVFTFNQILQGDVQQSEKDFQEQVTSIKEFLLNFNDGLETLQSWITFEKFIQNLASKWYYSTRSNSKSDFHQRITVFFMEIVTEFCFARENFEKIDKGILELIMSHVFQPSSNKTKSFSPLADYGVDRTPVVRSFLLQQLFKRKSLLGSYLVKCFDYNLQLASSSVEKWEICKLFMHCYEDHLTSESSKFNSNVTVQINHLVAQFDVVIKCFQNPIITNSTGIAVETLQRLSLARYVLANVTSLLCRVVFGTLELEDDKTLNQYMVMIEQLKTFILLTKNKYAHIFVLRIVIKNHGERALYEIIQAKYTWLSMLDDEDSKLSIIQPDKYVVHGDGYMEMRKRITVSLLSQINPQDIHMVKEAKEQTILMLAVMRNYTMDEKLLQNSRLTEMQDLHYEIKGYSIRDKTIMELLVHLLAVLKYSRNKTILQLHIKLAFNPHNLKTAYLPTMPGDMFTEVKKALKGRTYVCPNGHPYLVTECGRPMQEYTCPDCKAKIGGTDHNLLTSNKAIESRDATKAGHILGFPTERVKSTVGERNLTQVSNTIQRLLLHMAMLLGSKKSQQDIKRIIVLKSGIGLNVEDFLLGHVKIDLEILSKVLAKTAEETNLIVHLLLKHLMSCNSSYKSCQFNVIGERDTYEDQFDASVVVPFIKGLPEMLKEAQDALEFDKRFASKSLMRKLYGFDSIPTPPLENLDLSDCSLLWEFRQSLTLDSFKNVLQEQKALSPNQRYQLLSYILEQEYIVTMFADLPALVELQNILLTKFNSKFTKEQLEKTTIETFLQFAKDQVNIIKLNRLVERFFVIWKEISPLLKKHGRLRPDPNHYPPILTFQSNIRYILCSSKGQGRCMMSLLDFLAFHHNAFLFDCENIHGLLQRQHTVPLPKISSNDVISYNADRDLLPVVYSHCNYSFEIGKTASIKYDIEVIERSLLEVLYYGKAKIQISFEEYVCSDDVRRSKKFLSLQNIIPQRAIPYEEEIQILMEIPRISDISNALRAIEITMEILATTKGDPDHSYKNYIQLYLQMDPDVYVPSKKMQNIITFSYLTSMWTILITEKAKRHLSSGQQLFPNINEVFRVRFGKADAESVRSYLQTIDSHQLLLLVTQYVVTELPEDPEEYADLELIDALDRLGPHGFIDIPDFVQLRFTQHFWELLAEHNRFNPIQNMG